MRNFQGLTKISKILQIKFIDFNPKITKLEAEEKKLKKFGWKIRSKISSATNTFDLTGFSDKPPILFETTCESRQPNVRKKVGLI